MGRHAPRPTCSTFNVIIYLEGHRKIWHRESKRSAEYNKCLVYNNEDRILQAIAREISFRAIKETGTGIENVS